MFHTRLVRAHVWFYLLGVVHSHFFGKMARSRSRSPVCSIYQTWRAKQMHWQRVRWELRHHVKSFHGVRNTRDGLDALLRRYYSKTKEWSMTDRVDHCLHHCIETTPGAWGVGGGGGPGAGCAYMGLSIFSFCLGGVLFTRRISP